MAQKIKIQFLKKLVLFLLFLFQTTNAQVSKNVLWVKSGNYDYKIDNLNNHKPIEDIVSKSNSIYNLRNGSIFFVVANFKSQTTELFTIKNKDIKITFDGKTLWSDKTPVFNISNKASIITYKGNIGKNSNSKKSSISFFDSKDLSLYEFIYFPKTLSKLESSKIETYLSIKYGISLDKEKKYYNSGNKILWNPKEEDLFSNRITGIGRDDYYKLYQKESRNFDYSGLTIGLAEKNIIKDSIPDKSYLLWADNDKEQQFNVSMNGGFLTLDRIWKAKFFSKNEDAIKTNIQLEKSFITNIDNYRLDYNQRFVWLVVEDETLNTTINYKNAHYTKADIKDINIFTFNNIEFQRGKNYLFSFVIASEKEIFALQNTQQAKTTAKELEEKIVVYPNPLKVGEELKINIDLNKISDVSIVIDDMAGKQLITSNLGSIRKINYEYVFQTAGTYIATIYIDGEKVTRKIIVH